MSALITIKPTPRGGTSADQRSFPAQEIDGQWSWGSSPSTVMLTYVGQSPVTVGAEVQIDAGPYTLYGLCAADAEEVGRDGYRRRLQFVDFRYYLHKDIVFGVFNEPDVRIVNGQRIKRYWHILPADWDSRSKIYSDTPMTARQILECCLGAPTVLSPWMAGGPVFHYTQEMPVFSIDAEGGRPLAALIQEISERQGLLFTVMGGPYRLVWCRKGEVSTPDFPYASSRRLGAALSGHPTRLRIIGDRNLYQVQTDLTADWATAWEKYAKFENFVSDVFLRLTDPISNQGYNELTGDTAQLIGWQLAEARALTLTVREWVNLINGLVPGEGDQYADYRKIGGRSRMDMPVALYLSTLVYRAYRPLLGDFLLNNRGASVPSDSLDLANRLLCQVRHDPASGEFTTYSSIPEDGNGYAIVKGYLVGSEIFNTLRPEQMKPEWFSSNQCVWSHTKFSIDDSGQGYRFIVFDTPVVVSTDLFIRDANGLVVQNAAATLHSPTVAPKAVLVFQAEHYQWLCGVPGFDAVENLSSIQGEYVQTAAGWQEIPYADGMTADQKADMIGQALLLRQSVYIEGGWNTPTATGIGLTPSVDRVSFRAGPSGASETVDFTNERGPSAFQPEREFDRRTVQNSYFPGQQELRLQARRAELRAAGLAANPEFVHYLLQLLDGHRPGQTEKAVVAPGAADQTVPLPAGSVIRAKPIVGGSGGATNVAATHPGDISSADTRFVGATVLASDTSASKRLMVYRSGRVPIQVKGPVTANDVLSLSPDNGNYLVASGSHSVGRAMQSIADTSVQLIMVDLGVGGGGAGGKETWI